MNADLMMMMAPFLFALTIAVAALLISRRDEKAYYERKAKGLVGGEGKEAEARPPTQAELVRRRIFLGAAVPPPSTATAAETEATPSVEASAEADAADEPSAEPAPEAADAKRPRPAPAESAPVLGTGGLTVLRRWTVRPELEDAFERAWGELTGELRQDHGLDSAWLHRAEDGSYVATERWSSAEAYGQERELTHATAAALLEAAAEPVHPPLTLAMRAVAAG